VLPAVSISGPRWKRLRLISGDVNEYLRSITGEEFSAKDFRTWAGTVLATRELVAAGLAQNEREGKHKIVGAVQSVARRLGNRAATCRRYYVHPAVIDAYSDGSLFEVMQRKTNRKLRAMGAVFGPRSPASWF
jgi:DNA topoisomerase-1